MELTDQDLKDGVGVYCKCNCGGIIYAATNAGLKCDEIKKEFDTYSNIDYKIRRVFKIDVQENFGCKSKKQPQRNKVRPGIS